MPGNDILGHKTDHYWYQSLTCARPEMPRNASCGLAGDPDQIAVLVLTPQTGTVAETSLQGKGMPHVAQQRESSHKQKRRLMARRFSGL